MFSFARHPVPFIIAEAGVNHNGNPKLARELIDVALEAKADAIKFQTFKAWECASIYSDTADYQKKNSPDSESQFELLKSLELPFKEFKLLKEYAQKHGLTFISTPDGPESLNFLCDIKTEILKIGSGELNNLQFLAQIGQKGFPVILSTGMGTLGEIEAAIKTLVTNGASEVSLLHCTTNYPAPDEEMNLTAIKTLKQSFSLPTGLSDHSIGNEAAIAATAIGAQIIEKHITLDKGLTGPDHAASMNPDEFIKYVASIRKTAKMLGTGIKKAYASEASIKPQVRRSLVAKKDLKKGEILTLENLAIKRPETGISPTLVEQALNREILADLKKDEPITWQHLGGKL